MDVENGNEIKNGIGPRILVTGGSGLLGNELINQLLRSGNRVTAIYHKNPIIHHQNDPNFSTVHCNILDTYLLENILKDIDQVYHCAAIVSFENSATQELFNVNVEGTASVVNACISSGVSKFLFVSSVSAMGRIREDEIITEQMQWTEKTSNSNYGKSKYLAEMEVWRGIGEGLNAVIVNPTIILGGNSWENGSAAIFKSSFNEFPWYTDGVSGFVSVKDVVRAMILLMGSNITAERFILNGVNTTYKNVFTLIAQEFKKRPPIKKVTPLMSALIWRFEKIKSSITGHKPLLTKETASTAQAKVYFDNLKFLTYFPDFRYETIEKTIKDTCEAMTVKYNL